MMGVWLVTCCSLNSLPVVCSTHLTALMTAISHSRCVKSHLQLASHWTCKSRIFFFTLRNIMLMTFSVIYYYYCCFIIIIIIQIVRRVHDRQKGQINKKYHKTLTMTYFFHLYLFITLNDAPHFLVISRCHYSMTMPRPKCYGFDARDKKANYLLECKLLAQIACRVGFTRDSDPLMSLQRSPPLAVLWEWQRNLEMDKEELEWRSENALYFFVITSHY